MKSTRLAGVCMSVALLAGTFGVGCGAAPDGSESATGTEGDALKNCKTVMCDPGPVDPPPKKPTPPRPPPPPPTTVCGFDAMSTPTDPANCNKPYNSVSYPNAEQVTNLGCVSLSATDTLSVAQRMYISLGCSNPVYWYAKNPYESTYDDYGNAYLQMCPDTAAVQTYTAQLAAGGIIPVPAGADHIPHMDTYPGGFCDGKLPHAKAGYVWVAPWMDPKCGIANAGCMVEAF